jgi:hypothetical protein
MAAVNMSLVARSEYAVHQLMKRKNWAQREPGVIVVLVIVFLVAILVIAMFINKRVGCAPRDSAPSICSLHANAPYRRTQSQSPHKIPHQRASRRERMKPTKHQEGVVSGAPCDNNARVCVTVEERGSCV